MLNRAHAPERCSTVFGSKPKMPAMSSTHVSAVRCIAAAAVVHFQPHRRSHFSNVPPPLRAGEHAALSVAERDLRELRLVSPIQGRQLETPLSTVDSSEGVGPKAAHTLGSVERGNRVPTLLIWHLCEMNPRDLNQTLMSQLTGLTQMDGNDETQTKPRRVNFPFYLLYFDLLQLGSLTPKKKGKRKQLLHIFCSLNHLSINHKWDIKRPR